MDSRNLILSVVLSVGVLLLWSIFVENQNRNISNSIEPLTEESEVNLSALDMQ